MGLQQSKPIERSKSFSRSMSSLSEQNFQTEIITFSSELASLVCLESKIETFDYQIFKRLPFKEHYSPLPLCSNISVGSTSIFICYDCSINEEAFLCENCFQKGDHDSHRFSVYTNNAGYSHTFCRCGDVNFMKKKVICKDHKEASSKISTTLLDKKETAKFNAYFTAIFKTFSSSDRYTSLLDAMVNYLQKLTENNLYYSKMFLQFLFLKSTVEVEMSNLKMLLTKLSFAQYSKIFRNLNFVVEHKKTFLVEVITALNIGFANGNQLQEFIIHFAGDVDLLNELAKSDELILENHNFFKVLMKLKADTTEIWRCAVKKKLVPILISDGKIMKTLLNKLNNEENSIVSILEQLLEQPVDVSSKYVLACLMILAPDFFITKSKPKKCLDKKLQTLLANYYKPILMKMSTYRRGESIQSQLILLLPFFSFGETFLSKFWEEFERRITILQGYKERDSIRDGSWNYLDILSTLVKEFIKWDHTVMKKATQFNLISFTKEKDLIKGLLIQNFDKKQKIMRNDLLSIVDSYTQKDRQLAKDTIAKELRYNPIKEKYYYVGKILPNNPFNYQKLRVDADLPFSDWQSFVGHQFFNERLYRFIVKLISTAQRALKNDLEMVKTVSNLAVFLSIINKKEKSNLKTATRNFIKEIPDVLENTYYLLADIRNRFELDVDDMEEEGMKGRKKIKMDIIAEIRDKKFEEVREKQRKNREKWLKMAKQGFTAAQDQEFDEDVCYVCKENEGKNDRFVIPCNFTRNSVVSTLLHSEVTDLDMNVCLHQMHEECFKKLKKRDECPVCKFKANCFIPLKSLPDQSYSKNWLRTFEQITTNINLGTGKNFSSDWATIFLTYMVYTRSFKVLLESSELQTRARNQIDELIMTHFKSQLQKWPELTKQALDKAEKTVKGQIRRQSNQKKVVKSLVLDLVLEQITGNPFKNDKRIYKKFRELITSIGKENAQKISDCFVWARDNEEVDKTFEEGIADEEDHNLFKIKELPTNANDFMKQTSIKCPMCDKYQPQAWKCLFCEKMSCQNCMRMRNHCDTDHKGSAIFLYLNDALFELWADNNCVERGSLYRNEYLQGWTRSMKPEGWKANVEQIYTFFDKILHSESVEKQKATDDDSDDERNNIFQNQQEEEENDEGDD